MKTIILEILIACFCVDIPAAVFSMMNLHNDGCLVPPEGCPNSNITFHLYTGSMLPHKIDMMEPKTLKEAKFIPNEPVKILIHGYTGHKDYDPNTDIRPAYLKKFNYNVISLDYEELVREPCYLQATRNVPLVANCTAQFIDALVESGKTTLDRIHIVGFSLGGQVAGQLSNYITSGKLPRISGLDPALPMFSSVGPRDKLDATDALFVDVMHTNAGYKGKMEVCGHTDVYMNGGRNQPGCSDPGIKNQHSCSHARAPAYFAESIHSEVGFWGSPCSGWLYCALKWTANGEDNSSGKVLIGEYVSTSSRGTYSVQTNSKPPFARGIGNNRTNE